jgi:tetratricopeptide (TPR) repeat protein
MTRPLDDLLKLQDEIGCGVAETLKTVLCSDPNHRPGTNNLTAYSAYLKARDRRLKGDPKQAADLFQQAADADPNYALAWAGLAEACTVMEVNSLVPPRSMTGKARECALKAIALDASLAAPYAALGLLAAFSDRDWATGERYFQQALANNPNYAIAHAWYANTLLVQGKFAEAEAEYWRAHELDPLNPQFFNNLAETCHYQRQSDRCLAQAARALELDPGNQWARFNQAKCYTQAGRYEEALRVPLSDLYKNLNRFCILALSGRQAEARKLLPLVLKDWGQTSPYVMGIGYMCLGDKETAFVWLQKAAEQQQADLVSLKIDPAFEPLRDDPRYAALLRRVGLSP